MAPELPRIFLLSTHLQADELRALQGRIPTLTHDVRKADVIVGKISRPERALFELRRLKILTEPVAAEEVEGGAERRGKRERERERDDASGLPSKRPRLSETETVGLQDEKSSGARLDLSREPGDVILVLKLAWLLDSLEQDAALPVDDYLLYRGRKLPSQPSNDSGLATLLSRQREEADRESYRAQSAAAVLSRAAEDQQRAGVGPNPQRTARQRTSFSNPPDGQTHTEPPTLYHQTTSEHDVPLPPIPDFLHTTYSCQRPSLVNPPNAVFIKELKAVQIERLPGCGAKIAKLYQQWTAAGCTDETRAAAADTELVTLGKFYDIWGVADVTAHQFFKKGWRDLDDIVEYGWDSLSRVQQIGVKYYDEFQLKISRQETEAIAKTILAHARRIDPGFQMVIVGSYRRGKPVSGDVDVVLSHPDEAQTMGIINKLVLSLEKSCFITHTLSVWLRNSERGQTPLPWGGQNRSTGSGFDTLDKAMVVWQDPGDGRGQSQAPHRRVDIIISPWKTAGCAILGWSGETTFQRDLRRYCKAKLGFKFDSSGVRNRADGSWVDLESSDRGPAPDMETAERRVFERLNLEWRPPSERCTG